MAAPMTKISYKPDKDNLISEVEVTNDPEDGKVISLFSRHNTLEEYMKLLNLSKK